MASPRWFQWAICLIILLSLACANGAPGEWAPPPKEPTLEPPSDAPFFPVEHDRRTPGEWVPPPKEPTLEPPSDAPFFPVVNGASPSPRPSHIPRSNRRARCDKSCPSCKNSPRSNSSLSKRNDGLSSEILDKWTPDKYGGDMSAFMIALSSHADNLSTDWDDKGNPTTSAMFRPLRNKKALIGVQGLYGCTSVIVVSERGVWVSHFWEKSFSSPDWDYETGFWRLTDAQTFDDEVINPMKDGNQQTTSLKKHIDAGDFAPGTNPRGVIFTPAGPHGEADYQSRAELLQKTLHDWMPGSEEAIIVPYTCIGSNWNDHDISPKGKTLVQYEPAVRSEDGCGEEANLKVWAEDRKDPVHKLPWEAYQDQKA